MLRQGLHRAADSARLRQLIETQPVSSGLVARYIAGETIEDVVDTSRQLLDAGLDVTVDHLGEDTVDRAQAEAVTRGYRALLERLGQAGLSRGTEVSLKLSSIGQALGADGRKVATDNAALICQSAHGVGTTVTLDMEGHSTVDSTLGILADLRTDFPDTGAVLQAYLFRSEADCRDLAYEGSRVRLCKGAYREPPTVAHQQRAEVDRAYVRCLKILLSGAGYPMVATHDPRLIEIAGALATRYGRELGTYEYQLLYGIRPAEQERLAGMGERVRVYVPYGAEWYPYLTRRLAERSGNLTLFLRSLLTRN